MKNFFSVNKTTDKDAMDFDENSYLSAHVSDEVRYQLEHAFDGATDAPEKREPTAEEAALKTKSKVYWAIGLISLVGALGIFAIQGDKGSTVLTVIEFVLLVVSVVTTFLARRIGQKLNNIDKKDLETDFTAITDRLSKAAEAAARELGVPDGALSVEILPFHYKLAGDKAVSVGKKGRFDNIMTSMWVKDGLLCVATAQELYCVPLTDVRGSRLIDEDFEIDYWLKEEEPNSETYKEFNIRSSGLMGKKCHGYYAVDVAGAYEILVPGYDFEEFRGLVGF